MPKIVIDTSPLHELNNLRGVGTYVRELVTALREFDNDYSFELIDKPQSYTADLVHYPFFDLFFNTLPLRKQAKTVVTIHDVIPLVYPDFYPPGIKGTIRFQLQKLALKSVSAIITDSNISALDINSHLGIQSNQIHPIYLAAPTAFSRATPVEVTESKKLFNLQRPYLLYVGDINYNKNIPTLIKAYAHFTKTHDLVMVSRAMSADIPEARHIKHVVDDLGLNSSIHFLTKIPTHPVSIMVGLYGGAEFYLQPSLYEGFGLPVLEAMTCGAPVISTNGGSLPEIVGDAALICEPNQESLEKTIHHALSLTEEGRQHYIDSGFKKAASFRWSKTARQTMLVYQSVINNS